jgi:hypothetical protein
MSDKSFMVWIPPDLHMATRKKLAADGKTAREVVIRFLEIYTGYKVGKNEATGKFAEPTQI